MASEAGVQSRLSPGSGEEVGPGVRGVEARRGPGGSVRQAQRHPKEEEQEGVKRGQKSGVWLFYSSTRRKKEVPRHITPSGLLTGESDCYDFGEEVRWLPFFPFPEGTIRDAWSPQPITDSFRSFGFSVPSVPMSLCDFSRHKATISNSVSPHSLGHQGRVSVPTQTH